MSYNIKKEIKYNKGYAYLYYDVIINNEPKRLVSLLYYVLPNEAPVSVQEYLSIYERFEIRISIFLQKLNP